MSLNPIMMKPEQEIGSYVERLTGSQRRLYAYIYSLTANAHQASDILQETNRKLWELHDEFDSERDFMPWALKVAYNQIRAARKRISRERLVFQEDDTLETLHQAGVDETNGIDDRVIALETCLAKLKPDHRQLVERHYNDGEALEDLAVALDRRANTLAVTLHRIRITLAECIRGLKT